MEHDFGGREVTANAIVWHLQFDPQWSDPPRDETQSFEDFLAHRHPFDFSGACDDEDGHPIFGEAHRVDRTLRRKNQILVHVWWLGRDMPGSHLRFSPEKLKFTGRHDAPG